MVCTINLTEKPVLKDPVLIEGLPGIGFVANIATLHLINELKTPLFGEVHSSSFQDLAVTASNGKPRFPTNELYYHKATSSQERDLIILYGNTQALTTHGQYELCSEVLNIADDLGCRYVITLGGLRRSGKIAEPPKLYCAASDPETLKQAQNLGAQVIEGQIFGIAGLLAGLSRLWNIHSFCLLAETLGTYPDAKAAREVLTAINKVLHLQAEMNLDKAAETTHEILRSFGLTSQIPEETKKEAPYGWRI